MKKKFAIGLGVGTLSLGLILFIGLSWGCSSEVDVPADNGPAGEPNLQLVSLESNEAGSGKVYEAGEVHTESSRVYVFVGKKGLGHEHGVEGKLSSGTLKLDGGSPPGQLVFDMTSFTADTTAARQYVGLKGSTDDATRGKVTANMLGASVLNARAYPTAKLAVTSVAQLKQASSNGLTQYRIDGKFTLHGTTRPVSIIASAETKGSWTHLRGRFSILQTSYGIKPFSKAFGAIGVADQLTIWGDLWVANKKGRAQ